MGDSQYGIKRRALDPANVLLNPYLPTLHTNMLSGDAQRQYVIWVMFRGYISVMLLSCSMWSGALGSQP